MLPLRERIVQMARLIGSDAFTERFGPPQAAEPVLNELRSLIEDHIPDIARGLLEEAAASDDITDHSSAAIYLEDRLQTLGDLLTKEQAARIRAAVEHVTAGW